MSTTRLLDMGIDDYLITSTLHVVLGQRLVRKLCRECRAPYDQAREVLERFGVTCPRRCGPCHDLTPRGLGV